MIAKIGRHQFPLLSHATNCVPSPQATRGLVQEQKQPWGLFCLSALFWTSNSPHKSYFRQKTQLFSPKGNESRLLHPIFLLQNRGKNNETNAIRVLQKYLSQILCAKPTLSVSLIFERVLFVLGRLAWFSLGCSQRETGSGEDFPGSTNRRERTSSIGGERRQVVALPHRAAIFSRLDLRGGDRNKSIVGSVVCGGCVSPTDDKS
jgi:hypothetical protein